VPMHLRFLCCLARYVSQIGRVIARRPLRFTEINLLSRGPFDRWSIGDLITWHRLLQWASYGNERGVHEFQVQLLLRNMRRRARTAPRPASHRFIKFGMTDVPSNLGAGPQMPIAVNR
jgi:hypothetical protein